MRFKVQVWIFRAERVLVLHTNPQRGGFWQPVTGLVEPEEAVPDAALREAQEETGFSFPNPPVSLEYEFGFQSPWGPVQEHTFSVEAPMEGDVKIDPCEHDDYRWVLPEDALSMIRFESNAIALRRLMDRWSKQ